MVRDTVMTFVGPSRRKVEVIKSFAPRVTPFQKHVYQTLGLVPPGKVTTYKHLAAAVGCGSCQAVGQALRRNPHAPVVPCHRVVKSDGSIGGFGGTVQGAKIQSKIALLVAEGVKFGMDGKVDPSCVYRFADECTRTR